MSRAPLAGCVLLAACYMGETVHPLPAAIAADGSSARLRRLSVREVCNAYADLTGDLVTKDDFLAETTAIGFDNGPDLLMMQTDQAARFEAVAWRVAEAVVTRREPNVLESCEPAACRDVVVSRFAPRVYRRPLRDGEGARLVALYDQTRTSATDDVALETMLAAIFQSPAFLYREEIGTTTGGATRLAPYEIASELAFFVTGHPPDDTLLATAASGELSQAAARRREALRLLATPAAQVQWRTFLRQWLSLDDIAYTEKMPPLSFPPELARAMDDDVNAFFDDVLWSSTGSLTELFSSSTGFLRDPLPAVYGLRPAGSTLKRVALDPSRRGGILTRPAWLSVHASAADSGPIARGVFVLDALLCAPPPAPPPGISRVPPSTPDTHTTRDRFTAHVANPQCQTCHAAIDGIGFGFEEFDTMGAYRTTENGYPIDTSGTLMNSAGGDGPFVGVTELSRRLLDGDALRMCFMKQVFRFAMGAPEAANATPDIVASSNGFDTKTRISDLVVSFVESDLFVVRQGAP